ncbi:RagB/SusD family nutrient uptake outer membrane protein [Massilibacteroides sp.]|uniref:RagB/SusD family nutrient uptake outer membrane protein n=1 Tax=Massilibacteroides sp. TaxID=2034766 RepID=UPI002605AE5E|nr:RagB/SusD family nutrient uptake outer membrane protein [Massilibacteroides sp.]MDD4514205.1 RagB/SusD family nutrient uptake outer membrane protein [Massilibacteroides sp.]
MKTTIIKTIALGAIIAGSISCNDYLEKESFNIITPEQVWQNPKLINATLVNLYANLQLEDFNYWYRDSWRLMNPTTLSDEAQGSFQKDPMFDNGNASYTYEDALFEQKFSDRYKYIRNCNDFLTQLADATALTETEKKELGAEVRFLRAMHYFTLVKRYGGVPLVTSPQEYNPGDLESLLIERNKEQEIYDFIITETKEAAKDLPVTRNSENKYRANSGAALALCSRAALYAGSISKYGTVQLNGIIGIPSSETSRLFQEAYDASNSLLALNEYSLYNKKPDDKSQNYCDIFLKGNGDNGEYIFQKQYNVAGGKGHDWDKRNAPFSYRAGGWGCGVAPTLEMIEEYEYVDGREGTLILTDNTGKPRRFDSMYELFEGKDPRLYASVYLPGSPCQTTQVEWIRGIIVSDNVRHVATSQPDGGNTVDVDGVVYSTSGKDGGADAGDASKTGFYQKKFWDETLTDMNMGKSETPWPVFRLGETYLNLAEAAYELGKNSEALTAINTIRERSGLKALTDITMDKIRHERKIELAFEGHRYWDMKRWRIAHLDVEQGGLNGFRGSALYPWFDIRDNKYIFEKSSSTPKQKRVFLEKNYYTKINSDDMNSNPKLVQNPGYTN